jgi:protease PrsW
VLHPLIALVPVLLFLASLLLLDSFKLVRPRTVLVAVLAGGLAALVCSVVNPAIGARLPLSRAVLIRYIWPTVEEIGKAGFVIYLVRTRRIGFAVDAAILGFAVGTGFAFVENIDYLDNLGDSSLTIWAVRGFGTALLHGATAAIFALVSRTLADRWPESHVAPFLPGLLSAIAVHSAFNHMLLPPVLEAVVLVMLMPPLVLFVFDRSERATREWVGGALDLDLTLLDLVQSEAFWVTRFGMYLQELRQRFPGPIVADMFCLLRIELELSVQAKALLLARNAGLEIPVDDDLRRSLDELSYLERSIGPTGRLALRPLQIKSGRDQWHAHLLKSRTKSR